MTKSQLKSNNALSKFEKKGEYVKKQGIRFNFGQNILICGLKFEAFFASFVQETAG